MKLGKVGMDKWKRVPRTAKGIQDRNKTNQNMGKPKEMRPVGHQFETLGEQQVF